MQKARFPIFFFWMVKSVDNFHDLAFVRKDILLERKFFCKPESGKKKFNLIGILLFYVKIGFFARLAGDHKFFLTDLFEVLTKFYKC